MAYTPQTWVNGEPGGTPLSADRLNNIEAGIEDADNRLTTAEADIAGKADAAAPAAAVSDHVDATNPHAQYLQQEDADLRYILGSVAPTFANADATTAALDTKADQATVDVLATAGLQPPAKAPNLAAGQKIITTFAAGHGFAVTAGGTAGDNLNDTSDAILGAQSVKLVTDGTSAFTRADAAIPAIDLTERFPVLWVKVDDTTHLRYVEVWFGTGNFSNAYRMSPHNSVTTDTQRETIQPGQWTRVTMPWGTRTLVGTFGTPNLANINQIRVAASDDGTGNPVTVWFGGIGSMPEPRDVWPNGVVSMTFDDSYDNQLTVAKPMMDRYGFPGVMHNICNIVDTTGRVTVAQLRDAQDKSGWQVASHAYDIANHNAVGGFPSLDAATLRTDFRQMREWATENGFQDGEHLAYPQGLFNDDVLRMAERFFTSSRTTLSRIQETCPAGELHKLRVRNMTSTTTLSEFQSWVDDAYTNAYWLILVIHSVDNVGRAGGNSVTTTLFGQMVDYLAAKGIPVATTAEVLARRPLPEGAATQVAELADGGHAVTAGAETFSRLHATQGVPLTSGLLRLTRFTPHRDRTISNLSVSSGSTLGSGLTLVRLGLYRVNLDGSYTLVGATLSDTTMLTAASTVYTKALDTGGGLPASYTLRQGQRYAVGVLVVGATMPTVAGVVPAAAGISALAPVISQQLAGQTDLPTSTSSAVGNNNAPWFYLS